MFRKIPLFFVALLVGLIVLSAWLPLPIKSFFYALSLTIKSGIVFLLPLIIFGLLFKATIQLAQNATKLITFIVIGVCCSNFLATFFSHYVGAGIYHLNFSLFHPNDAQTLLPGWQFELPKWISNDKVIILSFLSALLLNSRWPQAAKSAADFLDKMVNFLLRSMMVGIPLFIGGFIIKLQHEGKIAAIFHDYALVFLIIGCTQLGYILCIYAVASGFQRVRFMASIKNMLPAAITGFSTMSSMAALPFTLMGVEKNAGNPLVARSIVPATVNIHLLGDCLAIPILAYAILKNYGLAQPLLSDYLWFTGYFVLAKFSVAAIPGGGILVMLPIIEQYLHFNNEMLSLITALYILFDPVITCANVLGNGGFAQLLDKLQSKPILSTTVDLQA